MSIGEILKAYGAMFLSLLGGSESPVTWNREHSGIEQLSREVACPMDQLPDELVMDILGFLDEKEDLGSVRLACMRLAHLGKEASIRRHGLQVNFSQLEKLSLQEPRRIRKIILDMRDFNAAKFQDVIQRFQNLEELDLRDPRYFKDLEAVASACKDKVHGIYLRGEGASRIGFSKSVELFPNIKELNLLEVYASSLREFPREYSHLVRRIDLYPCWGSSLSEEIIRNFPNLQKLNLCGFSCQDAWEIKEIAQICPNLVRSIDLNMRFCVSLEGFSELIKSFPNIQRLGLKGVTVLHLEAIAQICPDLVRDVCLGPQCIDEVRLSAVMALFPRLRQVTQKRLTCLMQ
jgi:hypothetical protein